MLPMAFDCVVVFLIWINNMFSFAFYFVSSILNMYKKLYGEKDGRVGMVMCSLARVKCGKGEFINILVSYYVFFF